MSKARVFVVQNQIVYKHETGKPGPKYDIAGSNARDYGALQTVLGNGATPFDPDSAIDDIWKVLGSYDPDHDYLLLVGNPCLIGWCVTVAASVGDGRVNLLQWSGKERKYLPLSSSGLTQPPSFD